MTGVRWKKLASGGDQPEPRWGHTSSQSGNNIIIIGGTGSKIFNDICIYDTVRNTWAKPEVRGTAPTPRLGHSTTTLPDGKLLIFGGKSDSKHYSDLHIFDPLRLAWVKSVQSPKSFPETRSGHTAILAPDLTRVIVFGGTSAHYKYFTNTFTLDLNTLTWTKLETKGEAPPKRGGHCAFLAYNKMFIFGGFDGKKYYNDLYCLSLDTCMWSKVEASGILPKPRSGHSATLINGGSQLLVFGGCGANSEFLSDVHILHLSDMRWDQPKCLGSEPQPRFRHTCSEVNNFLYIFSGTGSGNLLADTMLLELDTASPPRSPAPHTTTYTTPHMPSISLSHQPPPSSVETIERFGDIDSQELRKLYLAAMMSLKAEKQQREDYEITAKTLERELQDFRHKAAVEKSMRVAVEERLIEEHKFSAKLEQSTSSKIEKVTKKKQKALLVLQENLTKEQQQQQLLARQVQELSDALTKERQVAKELKQALTSVELRSQEGVCALTKELEEMKLNVAHMEGQELDSLSLQGLIDLETRHTNAYQNIFKARSERQEALTNSSNNQVLLLQQENQRLESGKVELESKVKVLSTDLNKCTEALSVQQTENETLKVKASRLEGTHMEDLSLSQLVELENLHHAGLRRVSQMRQEHMQKELEVLRKEKEALQEKQMCIICTEKPCNCVLLPCRHSSMCSTCCDLLTRCPICRSEITKRIKTYEK